MRLHHLKSAPDGLTAFKEVVNHVLEKRLPLSVAVTFRLIGVGATLMEATTWSVAHDIISLLSSALPVLVYLSISMPDNLFPSVAAALRHPAPTITSFDLDVYRAEADPAVPHAPLDLFMGSAPRLRRLALKNITLGPDPIPAFSGADSVVLAYAALFSDIEYARFFPRLRRLHLSLRPREPAPPTRPFNLKGVRLRKLTLDNSWWYSLMPTILRSTKIEDISSVVLNGGQADWTDPLWNRENDGLLSVRLSHAGPEGRVIIIVVVPEHRQWRRAYNLDKQVIGKSFPVLNLPGLPERLAYLRIVSAHVTPLLECDNLVLNALRELRVDLHEKTKQATNVWLPDWLTQPDDDASQLSASTDGRVNCSALQRVTLFAIHVVVRVVSQDVVSLGRALSQGAQPKQRRAALVLIGVELTPGEKPLPKEVFSAVCRHDFAGGDSVSGQEAGLWDDEFE